MKPNCYIVHAIKGRVRLRVEAMRFSQPWCDDLAVFLRRQNGVFDVRTNLPCCCVVITCSADACSGEQLLALVRQFVQQQPQSFGLDASIPLASGRKSGGISNTRFSRGSHHALLETARSFGKGVSALANRCMSLLPSFNGNHHHEIARVESAAVKASITASDSADAWHTLAADEVAARVQSSTALGLTHPHAAQRLRTVGANTLERIQPRSSLGILACQVTSLPVAMLLGSSVLCVITGGFADAAAILTVVFINTVIGYVTEARSESTVTSLLNVSPPPATVLREGEFCSIAASEVVPGDILLLVRGTYVAADARVLTADRLTLDESTLTGESMPVMKQAGTLRDERSALRDRSNVVYRGTVVTGGSGRAIVFATGQLTEIGRIQSLLGQSRAPETPVQRQLRQIGGLSAISAGVVCVGVFGVGMMRRYALLEMLQSTIALAVASIPEGLPMVATTTLALGVNRMRRRHVLVRRLDAVETLGSVQVFCLDKTGTLTLNRMTLVQVFADGRRYEFTDEGVEIDGLSVEAGQCDDLCRLLEIGVLCNEADSTRNHGRWEVQGTPTEAALVEAAMRAGLDIHALRGEHPVETTQYRTEDRNYMATRHRYGSSQLLAVKGRPVDVLELCDFIRRDGQVVPLTPEDRQRIATENDRMAGGALRVLALAYRKDSEAVTVADGQFVWLGLVGIADPIRPGMKQLMQVFHGAGIRTIMITGDQSPTAYAVAKELALSGDQRLEMLDSKSLEAIDPEVLKALSQRVHVFSAVSPSHKLQIVEALQRAGLVVAMTGDGINDGPALKAADIGVAMGDGGNEIAGMVSDIVLEDDNLQTMAQAIRQGRTIYGNTRNAIHYLLATNMGEVMVMLAAVGAGAGSPLNPLQLLWINLVTDVFPVLVLATQAEEEGTLERPPRDPHEPFLTKQGMTRLGIQSLAISAGTLASYGWALARYGTGPRANSVAFTSLTLAQLLHMFTARSDTSSLFDAKRLPMNAPFASVFMVGCVMQLGTLFFPPLRRLLGTVALGPVDLLAGLLGAAGPYVVNELLKKERPLCLDPPKLPEHSQESGPRGATTVQDELAVARSDTRQLIEAGAEL
jgi:Ca2+-transporting ATPase